MSTIVDNNRSGEEVLPHELISFSEKAYQLVRSNYWLWGASRKGRDSLARNERLLQRHWRSRRGSVTGLWWKLHGRGRGSVSFALRGALWIDLSLRLYLWR